MSVLLYFILSLIILLVSYKLLRRFKVLVGIVSLIPFILIPLWIGLYYRPFLWFKMYSVVFAVIFITIFRYTHLLKHKFSRRLIYAILFINMMEAVILDTMNFNFLNGIAGILLIITLPKIKKITLSKTKDLLWDIPFWWIIGYTIWDLVFVLNNFPTALLAHVAILGAPIIIECFQRKSWLQARAYTLGLYLVLFFIHPNITKYTLIAIPSIQIFNLANIFSLTLVTTYTTYYFYKKIKSGT